MIPLLVFGAGALLIWIGVTDTLLEVTGYSQGIQQVTGYPTLPILPYVVAAFLVTIPLEATKDSNQSWAWMYVAAILLGVIVVNYEGIAMFTSDLATIYEQAGG